MSLDNGSELPSPSSDSTTSMSEKEESEARDGYSDPVTGLTDVAKAQLALPQNQNRELLKYKKHLIYQCPAVHWLHHYLGFYQLRHSHWLHHYLGFYQLRHSHCSQGAPGTLRHSRCHFHLLSPPLSSQDPTPAASSQTSAD